jgi:hypothetical protein
MTGVGRDVVNLHPFTSPGQFRVVTGSWQINNGSVSLIACVANPPPFRRLRPKHSKAEPHHWA